MEASPKFAPNLTREPTAADRSACGGDGRFAAPSFRRRSVSGGCGSALRWAMETGIAGRSRSVLDCGSPLPLSDAPAPSKAAEGCRSPRRFARWVATLSGCGAVLRRRAVLDGVGEAAKEAELAFGERFSNGDGDRVFMDIQSEVECNSLHGVVVCSHSHDESERIPRPQRGRSCGSAHPGNPR
jgi:hypothetical protein